MRGNAEVGVDREFMDDLNELAQITLEGRWYELGSVGGSKVIIENYSELDGTVMLLKIKMNFRF